MNNELIVRIYSFSFHLSGIPEDMSGNNGGFVFDCRCLPNPGREIQYVTLTGKDEELKAYFAQYDIVSDFLHYIFKIVEFSVENYQSRGFTDLMVSFGCTGGQHRSVFCAEQLATYLEKKGVTIQLQHLELEKMNLI